MANRDRATSEEEEIVGLLIGGGRFTASVSARYADFHERWIELPEKQRERVLAMASPKIEHPFLHETIGCLYINQCDDAPAALRHFQRARELGRDTISLLNNLYTVLVYENRHAEAAEVAAIRDQRLQEEAEPLKEVLACELPCPECGNSAVLGLSADGAMFTCQSCGGMFEPVALGSLGVAAAERARTLEGVPIDVVTNRYYALGPLIYGRIQAERSWAGILEMCHEQALLEARLFEFHRDPDDGVSRGQGVSGGSANYIASLRDNERPAIAADYLRELFEDRSAMAARVRDQVASAENLLSNGLGALLDSNRPEDIELGGEITEFVAEHIGVPTSEWLLYGMAEIAVRRSLHDEAIGYLELAADRTRTSKILAAAESFADEVRKEKGFEPLHAHPRWQALLEDLG